MLINSITELIGNTPILKINKRLTGLKNIELYAKLEYMNPFGSLKDRTAYAMLQYHWPQIKDNKMTVIETSSGNTAKGLQCICNINGIKFITVTNRIKISESKNILKFIGANIKEVAKEVNTVEQIEEMIKKSPGLYFHTSQYVNRDNVRAHRETGKEIYEDIGTVDYFISVLGTSGSSTGISSFLKEKNSNLISIGVVTSDDSYIPGIRTNSELKEVGIYCRSNYDNIMEVSGENAKKFMKRLCRESGILAGASSGASFCAALDYLHSIDDSLQSPKKAVFIVCDRLETYANYIKENRFYKYHVLGNTYILIDSIENGDEFSKEKIKKLCSKEYGIGADGIIFGPLCNDGYFKFRAFNSDGSEADNAVFGAAIFAKYLKEQQIVKNECVKVQISGEKLSIFFDDNEATAALVTIDKPKSRGIERVDGIDYYSVNVGNENLVYECENISKEALIAMGTTLNASSLFPNGINVQMIKILDSKNVQIESYERGSGYTLASGTSIMAACFAVKTKLDSLIRVHVPGGICEVDILKSTIHTAVYKISEGELETNN